MKANLVELVSSEFKFDSTSSRFCSKQPSCSWNVSKQQVTILHNVVTDNSIFIPMFQFSRVVRGTGNDTEDKNRRWHLTSMVSSNIRNQNQINQIPQIFLPPGWSASEHWGSNGCLSGKWRVEGRTPETCKKVIYFN